MKVHKSNIDGIQLGGEVFRFRTQVKKIGVRTAAKEIGISAATVSRVERFHKPDLNTFLRLCIWMGVPNIEHIIRRFSWPK